MTESELKELLGLKLVFGIKSDTPSREELALFSDTRARGLILYRRNCQSPERIRGLISGMEDFLGYRLLVCIDHEGGRVVMPQTGVTAFPDNYAWTKAGATPAQVRHQGQLEAAQLRALGIDVNFAPVADVAAKHYNPGILSRSYGQDTAICAAMSAARIQGLQEGGISATAKHYPGKGHATVDAHLKLPLIESSLPELEATHLLPFFSAIKAGTDCIMSSHPLYRNIDSSGPATFSRKIISELLRDKYGFGGVIVSDALEMGAITEVARVDEAIIKAEEAGHDLLLVCTPGTEQKLASDALLHHYLSGKGTIEPLMASAERIRQLHKKRPQRFGPPDADFAPAENLARKIASKAVRVLQRGNVILPITKAQLKSPETLIIVPRYKDIADTVMIEPGMEDMESFVRRTLQLRAPLPPFAHLPMNPSEADIAELQQRLSGKKLALLLLWDAGLSAGWKKALEYAQQIPGQAVVLLLRDFYDERFLSANTCAATAFGFRKFQTEAALRALIQS